MARKPHPREDFLTDATALVQRVELWPAAAVEPVLAGFRADGSVSLMFGEDPVYQFNSLGQLRRAFVDGRIYKADAGRLVALTRDRQDGRIQMVAEVLPDAAARELIASLSARLADLAAQIKSGQIRVVAAVPAVTTVPADVDVVARLTAWLILHAGPIEVARTPHAR
jgi:hypothetical protein